MKIPVHVAIIGGSGSGKTWLAEKIASRLGAGAARLSLDDFYLDLSPLPKAEREAMNFDDPAAIDWEKFHEVMGVMRAGESLELPIYDFATHTRKAETRVFLAPALVIWDGLWLLHHPRVRGKFARAIFVECDVQERFRRRAERDVRERGRTFESVRRQFFEHVQPMHDRFVEPQRGQAARIITSPVTAEDLDGLVQELPRILPGA